MLFLPVLCEHQIHNLKMANGRLLLLLVVGFTCGHQSCGDGHFYAFNPLYRILCATQAGVGTFHPEKDPGLMKICDKGKCKVCPQGDFARESP
jgi:hypothetical protein